MTAASLPSTGPDEAGHSLADMKDMAVDAQGALWLVNQNKLVRFDGKTATEYISDFSLDKVDADGMDIYLASTTAFIKFKDGHFDATPLHYWSIDRSIAPTHSGSIDRDGNYHAGARGLFKLRPDGTCEELSFFKGKHISSTTSDKNGDIWVACSWASPFLPLQDHSHGYPRLHGEGWVSPIRRRGHLPDGSRQAQPLVDSLQQRLALL